MAIHTHGDGVPIALGRVSYAYPTHLQVPALREIDLEVRQGQYILICGGSGCRVCKHTGWLEILGAGLIDPEVFKKVGYDPEVYSGFAFGLGIERIAMLKYGITDIRLYYENDLRFLSQF